MLFHPPKQISAKKKTAGPSPAQPEDVAVSVPLGIAASVAP